ncbi:MAG: Fpg/Nei family DNA glycosylase [Chloroflexi bacterium]|nr:Fpg/Nei family DNA glycosylase [Chloroflexota bacterium]
MPEIPEMEAIKGVLNARVRHVPIAAAVVRIPIVVRLPPREEFERTLTGNRILNVERRGKWLLLRLASGHTLAANLMLTGRLALDGNGDKLPRRTCWLLDFQNGRSLRYFDERLHGKAYLLPDGNLDLIPRFAKMGPDVLDPALTFEVFRKRIQRYRGQIKSILVNDEFVTGIGNAYADEVLFAARIYPFRVRTDLSDDDLRRLYDAIHSVLAWAMPIAAERIGERVDEKVRDFLKVHRKGGQPCPVCGATITEIAPNQRITSYCRRCQDWGLTGG